MSDKQQEGISPPQTILPFEGFTSLNTNASRPGIKDTELSWCDGFMPLGDSNLRTLPGIGVPIFETPPGTTVNFFDFGNIAVTPYLIAVPSDGSVWLVDTFTLATSEIAPPGTVMNPSRATVGLTQWGSTEIILVSQQENGYWVLDGDNFYGPGSIAPFDPSDLTSGGEGYTAIPTYTVYGGSGSGVTFNLLVQDGSVTNLLITNPGTGYLPGDVVQVGFQGGGTDTTPILTSTLTPTSVGHIIVIAGGSGYPDGTFPLGISGGGGSGAAGRFAVVNGIVTGVGFTAAGSGYTSAPIISFPIPGSGASITANEVGGVVTALTIANGGTGYQPGTYALGFIGSGRGSGAVATYTVDGSTSVVSTNITSGGTLYPSPPTVYFPTGSGAVGVATLTPTGIASVNVVNGGTNLTGTPGLTVVGGGGFGAVVTATVSGGSITSVAVGTPGTTYTSAPAIEVAAGFNNAASAILTVMPFGISGTAASVYESRVWVVNPYTTNPKGQGGTVNFSAPGSYTDFATSDGGGSFTSNDPFLRVAYIQPVQTNGFLYLIADSSINYIGGVSTAGSPPETTFTNQNADPETGTPYAGTVDVLGSNIVFANEFGVHVSYGGRVSKVSIPLDGFYGSAGFSFGGFQPSACKAIIYGKRVWALLIPVIDQITGLLVNKLCMWNPDAKAWWTTEQDVPLIYVQHQEISSILTAYGTNGQYIYPLFQSPSTIFSKTIQSKLYAKPGGYMETKTSNRAWVVAQYFSSMSPALIFQTDNELGLTASQLITLMPTLANPPVGLYVSGPAATGQAGALLGMTITTNAADVAIISAAIDSVPVGYRG